MGSKFDSTCRACLSIGVPADSPSLLDPETRLMFAECTYIEVPPSDSLPQQLCVPCFNHCQSWSKFLMISQENDQQLKNIVQQPTELVELFSEEREETPEKPKETFPADDDREMVIESYDPLDDEDLPTTDDEEKPNLDDEEKPLKPTDDAKKPKEPPVVKYYKPWMCLSCDDTFRVFRDFRNHLKEHLKNRICPLCSVDRFRTIDKAADHYVDVHIKTFACSGCPKRYRTQDVLVSHIREIHNSDRSLLDLVGPRVKRIKKKKYCRKGQKVDKCLNKTNGDIKCGLCNYSVDTIAGFSIHFRVKHESSLVCEICKEVTTDNQEHLNHVYLKHMECRFECQTCGLTSPSPMVVRKHMYEDHSGKKTRPATLENFVCDICGKTFLGQYSLNAHAEFHKDAEPCPICKKRIKGAGALKFHIKRHTEKRDYQCDVCEKSFKVGHDLKTHRKRHFEEERKFECETCGLKFFSSSNLNTHRVSHTGERNHKCPYPNCDKAYQTSSDLKTHSRVHTGERPFACKLCPDTFSRRTSLVQHARVHLNKKK